MNKQIKEKNISDGISTGKASTVKVRQVVLPLGGQKAALGGNV